MQASLTDLSVDYIGRQCCNDVCMCAHVCVCVCVCVCVRTRARVCVYVKGR